MRHFEPKKSASAQRSGGMETLENSYNVTGVNWVFQMKVTVHDSRLGKALCWGRRSFKSWTPVRKTHSSSATSQFFVEDALKMAAERDVVSDLRIGIELRRFVGTEQQKCSNRLDKIACQSVCTLTFLFPFAFAV